MEKRLNKEIEKQQAEKQRKNSPLLCFSFFILFVLLITSPQLFITCQAKTIYEETIDEINNIEDELSIPKNKYLKSIKDELESRKQSLTDLSSSQAEFCDEIATEASNSIETIIDEASNKICKSKRKTKRCFPKDLYDNVIPQLEEIENKLTQDLDDNSFLDICEDSNSPLGCLIDDEMPEDISAVNDTQIKGCANETINVNESNLTQSSTAMLDSLLDLGEVQALKYSTANGDIYIFKNTSFIPVEVLASLSEQTNVTANVPFAIALPPKSQKYGFRVCKGNASASWSYKYSFTTALGLSTNTYNGDGKYFLPFKAGEAHEVTQGEMGTFSHFGEFLYSIDFDLIEEEFTAMRDGIVVFVKEDSNEGGADRSFEDKANFIWVLQPDGSVGRYVHLQQNGALVNLGDKVKAGDVIGLSGNTGFTSGPHLHVQVVFPKGFEGEEKIPIRFQGIEGALDEGASYTALPMCK